jgi:hypothetical protein
MLTLLDMFAFTTLSFKSYNNRVKAVIIALPAVTSRDFGQVLDLKKFAVPV